MKARESGMPEEALWAAFFQPEQVLAQLRLTPGVDNVVDFGCGYGTFTIPAARVVSGTVWAIDIDPQMVATTRAKAAQLGLRNVDARQRDFMTEGIGLPDANAGYAMVFNILHAEEPQRLLREAWRVLVPGGILAILHWRHDATTPRGPSMAIRPRPEQCLAWARECGFELLEPGIIDLPPYHYGMALVRPADASGSTING
jgi:SAM-dependent methyltransferase